MIQVSDLTGSLGVSFLIALVGARFVDLFPLPLVRPTVEGHRLTPRQTVQLCVVSSLLITTLGYGAFRLGTSKFRDGPRVALLQASLIQGLKDKETPANVLGRYEALILRAIAKTPPPDLLIWPETSFPYSYTVVNPSVNDPKLDKQIKQLAPNFNAESWRQRTIDVTTKLHNLTDEAGVPMLVGP